MENLCAMPIHASQILNEFKTTGILESMSGPDTLIQQIDNVEVASTGSLVFVSSVELAEAALAVVPAAVVTSKKLANKFNELTQSAIFISANVKLAHAALRTAYADRNVRQSEWGQIHTSAVVHESAKLAADVVIGPGVVIGAGVRVGSASVILANSVLEAGAQIGADTIIHPCVVIGYNCEVGDRVIIKSGCVIGMEGFGFAEDSKGKHHRIPQLGKVVIEDDVVLGANCNIDRATYKETRISAGCKFDALCHIAHNVVMDEDCIVVAQTGIAGSVRIGKRVLISGQAAISDHVVIADDVTLVHRAGVMSDIKTAGIYAGIPTQPLRQYFKNIAAEHQLTELRQKVFDLEKQLAKLAES